MLVKVEVRGDQGTLLVLPLSDISEGFLVEDIEGLDPVKATLVSSSFAQLDGAQFQSAKNETRNIVFKIAYEPDYAATSVQALRNTLYKSFMPKSQVKLRFFEDTGLTVEIAGRVESFDSPRFAQAPTATISIVGFDPDFYDITPSTVTGSTTATTTEVIHQYAGTTETGFLYTLNVNRSISEFTLFNTAADNVTRSLIFASPLVNADILKISTVNGSKSATLTRGGSTTSILFGVSPYSNWLDLFPGENRLRAYAEGAAIPWSIDYTNKYGGL